MQVKMSITLHMSEAQRKAWAEEYGLALSEVDEDASGHLGSLVHEAVKQVPHIGEFATLTGFTVK